MSGLSLTLTFDGHRVRMAGTAERPEWVARDVCRMLQLPNTAQALADARLSEEECRLALVATPGGPQRVRVLTEQGLVRVIFNSRKPAAVALREWLISQPEFREVVRRLGLKQQAQAVVIPEVA